MIGQRLKPRTEGASAVMVVGQQAGGWVVVDVAGSSPRLCSPAELAALYDVEPLTPIEASGEVEAAGWGVLAEVALESAITAAQGVQTPTVEDVFGAEDGPT